MKYRVSFKHMKSSEKLEVYAKNKLKSKFEKYSTKPVEASIVFEVDGLANIVHFSVRGGDGFNAEVSTSSNDMHNSIGLAMDKLEIQLKKQKERLKNHRASSSIKNIDSHPEFDQEDCDMIPIDAEDLIKYEKARLKMVS